MWRLITLHLIKIRQLNWLFTYHRRYRTDDTAMRETVKAEWWSYLAIFLCVGACQQRMEDNDCFVQIPHKHPLENKKKNFSETFNPCVCIYVQMTFETSVSREAEDQREFQGNLYWHLNGIFIQVNPVSAPSVGVFWSLTSRSLSGGGEGLFLRPLPRDLEPPLRQARSSNSLIGVEGLCTVSKSPERVRKHRQEI